MSKAQVISYRIAVRVNSGMAVCDAFNDVLGAGSYEKLASEVYDELNNRA